MGLFQKVSLFYKLVCPLKMSGKYLLCFVDLWSQNVIINPFPKDWNEIKNPQFNRFLLRGNVKYFSLKKSIWLQNTCVLFQSELSNEKTGWWVRPLLFSFFTCSTMRKGPPLKWASNVSLWNCFEAVKKSLWSNYYAKVASKLILIPIWMNGSGTRPFNFDPWMGKHHEITWTTTLGHNFSENGGFTLFIIISWIW